MKRLILIVAGALLILAPRAWAGGRAGTGVDEKILAAIRQVESGGNDNSVGDKGKAIGPYQIHHGYWKDATDFDKSIGGTYKDCFKPDYAKKVVKAYLRRYAPKDASYEVIARIHNGGGGIMKRQGTKAWINTTKYWNKVRKVLEAR